MVLGNPFVFFFKSFLFYSSIIATERKKKKKERERERRKAKMINEGHFHSFRLKF